MARIAFNGSGLTWHPVLNHVLGNDDAPGIFFRLRLTELRLYLFVNWRCTREGARSADIKNQDAIRFTGLDKNSLARTRRALQDHKLINVTKLGRGSVYRYEITDPRTGHSLRSNQYPRKAEQANDDEEDWAKF
jgi:hypothetical protein